MSEATQNNDIPALNIIRIIQMVVDFAAGDREAIKPALNAAGEFVKEKASSVLNEGLEQAGLNELSDGLFSEKIVECVKDSGKLVHEYMSGKMNEEEFVACMRNVGIQDIQNRLLSAFDIPEKLGVEGVDDIYKLSPLVLAFTASVAAYKEIRKALDDLAIAHEYRIRIEQECEESIRMIRQYRIEMEEVVSKYLTERLETFERGFDAMDKALIDGDSDGYLYGNAEIQKVLKYQPQFTDQEEFDNLMDSDDAFKL